MKRKTLLFSLLLTFLAPWTAMAQETLTVYSNTTLTQSNAPMFVEYFKNYTITQTVFPASDLTAMSGKTITAITFYTTSTNIPYTTQASAVIYLKEVQNATISAYIDKSTATTVCTGYYEFVSDGNDGGMVTITFTTPFPYNGGNLLFGCENTNRVDCKKMSFKGISQNGASMGGQSTSLPITGTNQRNFLPKTTFTYTFTYSQPVNLQVSSVTDQSATLTWQAPETTSTIVGYSYNYKEHSASEWSTDYQANDTEATLNNLDSFTEYDFRVKALYSGNHESSYVTTTFRTECATITVTAETPWTENFEDFYHVTHAVISPNSDNKAFRMDDGCWNMVNLETGGFNPVLYTSYSDAAFSGSSSVQFYNRGGASILILPEFTNTLNTLQFEFKASYFNIDTQGTLEIGYYYGNAFHAVCTSDRITCGRGSSGHNAIGDYMGPYPLTGEIPSGSRMALRYTPLEGAVIGSTSGVSAGAINLDDFRVSITPSCVTPRNLKVIGGVTANSVTLGWTEQGNADAWQICLNGDETNLIFADSNPFMVTGLTANTAYTAKVRAYCSDEYQSDWCNNIVSFTTECASITDFPWSEDFEHYASGNFSDHCWVNEHISGDESNIFKVYTSSNGGNNTHQLQLPDMKAGTLTKLVLPEMSLPNGDYQFSIDVYRSDNTYNNQNIYEGIRVYVSTNGEIEGATELAFIPRQYNTGNSVIPAVESVGWYTYSLPIGISGTCYIILRGESQYCTSTYMDNLAVLPTFTKTIVAYGDTERDKYYLIASPVVEDITPSASNGFLSDTYDLFYFDQSGTDIVDQEPVLREWRAYNNSNQFDIVSGKGYLYASKDGTTLTFAGTPYNGNGKVTLSKTEGVRFSGWNLVGNPFQVNAYPGRAFYTINDQGDRDRIIAAVREYVEPMEGIFVIAETNEETMTFSTDAPGKKAQAINVNVTKSNSRDAAVIDRAIVRFDESRGLPKFQLDPNHTKIYIPQNGTDYAVVNADNAGALPVSFKAEADGQYTISVNAEEVSFNYLHLIDNLTGADVDLLVNPSYTFSARTTDYASRFKLVFAATGIEENGASTGSATFAFYSNGSWVIANPSTGSESATLQVIDMTGRILSSKTINGNCTKVINAAQGIYMLRLVNGDNVRVQKIVVK